jgi:hypothetical protein
MRVLTLTLAVVLALGALTGCGPKSQCGDGSIKNTHGKNYHCYNGEWVKD